uniref:Uncharacterized protein n=1 Tax=viral metagenome TaxID=1070528 RepID=A0A6C0D851_9ZZZZ
MECKTIKSALRLINYIIYMNRNRTIRKHHDLSGATIFKDYSLNEGLQELLKKESEVAFKKPWHRLERGMRLNRLRLFVDNMKDSKGLQETEATGLFQLLAKSLEKKLLNSKNAVVYDIETEKILEIKNLVMHQKADGSYVFQLLDKPLRNSVTMRKKNSSLTSQQHQHQQQPQQQQQQET